MTMKQLATTFLAILFAGYAMAVPFDVSLNTTQTMSSIYEEGSGSSTVELSSPFDEVSVYCKEGKALNETVRRLKEDFYKHETKVRSYKSNVDKVMDTLRDDKGWVELKNYIPSAEREIKCYCEERDVCPTLCSIRSCRYQCNYNYYCYDRLTQITGKNISECPVPSINGCCSDFIDRRTSLKNHFLHYVTQLTETAKTSRFSVEFVRESIRSMDNLLNSSWEHCRDPTNTLHAPEATELLLGEVKNHKQLAENITKDFIYIETKIDQIEGTVKILAKSAIKEINGATKGYACCLKYKTLYVEGVDCQSARFTSYAINEY